ncbi:hypothetical protein [Jiella pelagia]|uniref:Secreted protein n=1 Tax=Jiella pelagia TaxID=2986949 RepID=A0ABY7C5D9_9HYPH|nr:hypothetical protein [Jiella pelagia]WAP70802.1 hypothetical protein OH818_12845 [Jiella pelagia]
MSGRAGSVIAFIPFFSLLPNSRSPPQRRHFHPLEKQNDSIFRFRQIFYRLVKNGEDRLVGAYHLPPALLTFQSLESPSSVPIQAQRSEAAHPRNDGSGT